MDFEHGSESSRQVAAINAIALIFRGAYEYYWYRSVTTFYGPWDDDLFNLKVKHLTTADGERVYYEDDDDLKDLPGDSQ